MWRPYNRDLRREMIFHGELTRWRDAPKLEKLFACRGSSLVERRPEKAGVASSILAPGTRIFFFFALTTGVLWVHEGVHERTNCVRALSVDRTRRSYVTRFSCAFLLCCARSSLNRSAIYVPQIAVAT